MKTFTEFLIEGRGFSWNGSKYSSGFGRYTKNGEDISREEYMKASEAYKFSLSKINKMMNTNSNSRSRGLAEPEKIDSKKVPSYGGLKSVYGNIIPESVLNADGKSFVEWLSNKTETVNFKAKIEEMTGLGITKKKNFIKWATEDGNNRKIGSGGRTLVDTLWLNEKRMHILRNKLQEHNIDEDEWIDSVNKSLKSYVKDTEVCVRCESSVLDKILKAGRFKTQFETKTSGGKNNFSVRANIELGSQNLKYATDDTKRPIYGTIKHKTNSGRPDLNEYDRNDIMYGDICIVLKSDVRNRSTLTMGDSLNERSIATPLNNPDYRSMLSYFGENDNSLSYEKISKNPVTVINQIFSYESLDYPEVQIHGGVSVDDIEYVYYKGRKGSSSHWDFKENIDLMNKLGIKFVEEFEE